MTELLDKDELLENSDSFNRRPPASSAPARLDFNVHVRKHASRRTKSKRNR